MGGGYGTFRDFYPFYLGEHQSRSCRRMHFIGTSLVLLTLLGVFESGDG